MLIKNISKETLQRNDKGPWTVTKPGETLELTKEQADWLVEHEPHFWAFAQDMPEQKPGDNPVASKKRGGK